MADLSTTYMGFNLKHPVVPSASPISRTLDGLKELEDAGAPAVVMYSLFEEQVSLQTGEFSEMVSGGELSVADALEYFPRENEYVRDADAYVEHVHKAKEALEIPIIASMNGTSKGGWLDYAQMLEEAGADAIELNIYFIPTTDNLLGMDIENLYFDILGSVKERVNLPVAVKLSPFFSAIPDMAVRLDEAGADALVLFNRFYQPDIDVQAKSVVPRLALSRPEDILLPLRWIAILYGQVDCSLALTSGVHSGEGVLKAILAGADVANVCSVLLQEGVNRLTGIVEETEQLLDSLGAESISALRGDMSLEAYVEPTAFERGSYIQLLQSYGRI
ncbi:MAG: dihydroorotate dehydrogenase-like protein [Anaerolineales bacterium]|jgi:dihydroorotate dehydrogenase (fumarate)